ncbi:hypothetical protein DL96DRAFT_1685690 [Flagelloscypha sp. PMI_526]|nr:hypothetical protein DL96DRAFT_1685690 [Flagelloscypha sp. PMI_526]
MRPTTLPSTQSNRKARTLNELLWLMLSGAKPSLRVAHGETGRTRAVMDPLWPLIPPLRSRLTVSQCTIYQQTLPDKTRIKEGDWFKIPVPTRLPALSWGLLLEFGGILAPWSGFWLCILRVKTCIDQQHRKKSLTGLGIDAPLSLFPSNILYLSHGFHIFDVETPEDASIGMPWSFLMKTIPTDLPTS